MGRCGKKEYGLLTKLEVVECGQIYGIQREDKIRQDSRGQTMHSLKFEFYLEVGGQLLIQKVHCDATGEVIMEEMRLRAEVQ